MARRRRHGALAPMRRQRRLADKVQDHLRFRIVRDAAQVQFQFVFRYAGAFAEGGVGRGKDENR